MHSTSASTPTHYLTATQTAAAIRDGSLTSEEAVRAYLARIEALNPRFNVVVDLHADEALARAREADAATARGESWGPLHGVPITVKDVYDVAGMRITFGWPPMRRNGSTGWPSAAPPPTCHRRATGHDYRMTKRCVFA